MDTETTNPETLETFEMYLTGGKELSKWRVILSDIEMIYEMVPVGGPLSKNRIPKKDIAFKIDFPEEFFLGPGDFNGYPIIKILPSWRINIAGKDSYVIAPYDLQRLKAWIPPITIDDHIFKLRNWGIGLIVVGILHFIFSRYLDPVWGGILIIVGAANLFIPRWQMIIVNGLSIIIAGFFNSLYIGNSFIGIIPLWIGLGEIIKARKYDVAIKESESKE